jgi:hypothetical protein
VDDAEDTDDSVATPEPVSVWTYALGMGVIFAVMLPVNDWLFGHGLNWWKPALGFLFGALGGIVMYRFDPSVRRRRGESPPA